MTVDSAAIAIVEGRPELTLVIDGVAGDVGECKPSLLQDGIVALCGALEGHVHGVIPADPRNGRPESEAAAGVTDDPVVVALACEFWLAMWEDRLEPGPVSIPSSDVAVGEAKRLRARVRAELAAADT
jgi:hypothetical protein